MISAWWIPALLSIGAVIGYALACLMFTAREEDREFQRQAEEVRAILSDMGRM